MTTITIREDTELLKTEFDSTKELFEFLRKKLSPVPIFLVDDEDIPKSISDSIEKAQEEADDAIIDFQG